MTPKKRPCAPGKPLPEDERRETRGGKRDGAGRPVGATSAPESVVGSYRISRELDERLQAAKAAGRYTTGEVLMLGVIAAEARGLARN